MRFWQSYDSNLPPGVSGIRTHPLFSRFQVLKALKMRLPTMSLVLLSLGTVAGQPTLRRELADNSCITEYTTPSGGATVDTGRVTCPPGKACIRFKYVCTSVTSVCTKEMVADFAPRTQVTCDDPSICGMERPPRTFGDGFTAVSAYCLPQ